jgi:hypothetical protein
MNYLTGFRRHKKFQPLTKTQKNETYIPSWHQSYYANWPLPGTG